MRYAAFLRGVMPTNCKMADLKKAFEDAGFTDVKTILGSGNVTFDGPKTPIPQLERKVEAAIEKSLGKSFMTFVRPVEEIRSLLENDPYKKFKLNPGSKRVVTFLRKPPAALELPIEKDNARILLLEGNDLFSAYLPTEKGPVFMNMIEKAAGGKDQTTRTWDTLAKVAG